MQGCQEQKQNLGWDDCFCEKSQENLYAKVHVKLDTWETLPSPHFHFLTDLDVQDALRFTVKHEFQE